MGVTILLHDRQVLLLLPRVLSHVLLDLAVVVLGLKMLGLVEEVNCSSTLLLKCDLFYAHLHTALILNI